MPCCRQLHVRPLNRTTAYLSEVFSDARQLDHQWQIRPWIPLFRPELESAFQVRGSDASSRSSAPFPQASQYVVRRSFGPWLSIAAAFFMCYELCALPVLRTLMLRQYIGEVEGRHGTAGIVGFAVLAALRIVADCAWASQLRRLLPSKERALQLSWRLNWLTRILLFTRSLGFLYGTLRFYHEECGGQPRPGATDPYRPNRCLSQEFEILPVSEGVHDVAIYCAVAFALNMRVLEVVLMQAFLISAYIYIYATVSDSPSRP
eukprot:scaffold1850_cov194-Pinguiococcus_pyrenoidosus.AAC.16